MEFKVVLVGPSGSGKTTLLKRLRIGVFEPKYIPTMGVEVTLLTFHTNKGAIIFKVWDCAGNSMFEGLGEGYWHNSDAAIILGDSSTGKKMFDRYGKRFLSLNPRSPCLYFEGKSDLSDDDDTDSSISSRFNRSTSTPFLRLAKKLVGDDIVFLDSPPLTPPTIDVKIAPAQGILFPEYENVSVQYVSLPDGGRMKITTHTTVEYEI